MSKLLEVPITAVISLTAERAVDVVRTIFRAESGYAKISPMALTISSRLTTADGGIDAEIDLPKEILVPSDCIFNPGLTGFQIKSGTSFRPWTLGSIRKELVNSKGELYPEVNRLVSRGGRYVVICTGHDLTPEQRNKSRSHIAKVLASCGFDKHESLIDVLGASQIADFAERYPATASQLAVNPIQEAWVLDEWERDAHMANNFEPSPEQGEVISRIRSGLQGEVKHLRLLGEPGLGKTRIVLEAVKEQSIKPYILYFQYGTQFGQTGLFRQLLRSGYDKPLILVIDELPEMEMADLWRHLKPRCGKLKIISIDHGHDETRDEEIERITVPRLPDDVIKKILIDEVGEHIGIERWTEICGGSPRVAQAVAENLKANPSDLLKPPATVPIWARFLHGYGPRDAVIARQIECIAQHLALFSRFGYEDPVSHEALYIAERIKEVDPTIGLARFQEVVQNLRARRVLQGSRTLFFVPKALHIYLWRQFWERYGHGFKFAEVFKRMPESLHVWFMRMFKFADEKTASSIVDEILRSPDVFSDNEIIVSDKGGRFLSILAEANPKAVLLLLENTIGAWTDQELFEFKESRQNVVWTLEKIAVWPSLTVRAIQILSRLAINENADFANNATGTLTGLFAIGLEAAVTESSPKVRLPAMLKLFRGPTDAWRRLALKAMESALRTTNTGFRLVGPEYQGLRERAKLWMPTTYGELWDAQLLYFQLLVDETKYWPSEMRPEICNSFLNAVDQQILNPKCTELVFDVLSGLLQDTAMAPDKLNAFFWSRREYKNTKTHRDINLRLHRMERYYTKRSVVSRFQRYVVDVDYFEWNDEIRQRRRRSKSRARLLVDGLVSRIVARPEEFEKIVHLLAPSKFSPALRYFGVQLAEKDLSCVFLANLIRGALTEKHDNCLAGYFSILKARDYDLYSSTIQFLMSQEATAWLGVTLSLEADYDAALFVRCLEVLENGWIEPRYFSYLRAGNRINVIPGKSAKRLLDILSKNKSIEAKTLLVELLDDMPLKKGAPIQSKFAYRVVKSCISRDDRKDVMSGYHWKQVSLKLIKWDPSHALPLLDALLQAMRKNYRLSYDNDSVEVANEIVKTNPFGAWEVIRKSFEKALPKWRSDIFTWLKGGLVGFDERVVNGAIVWLPYSEVVKWIDVDPERRAVLIAHAVPATFDDKDGGELTRELLSKYGHVDGVMSSLSATFHSGGWSGPTSAYLKRKREKCRNWLAAGFGGEIDRWIEREILYLDRQIEHEEISEERDRFD